MTRDDIIKLAGHRHVPAWVLKLVFEAVAAEREACALICEVRAEGWDSARPVKDDTYGVMGRASKCEANALAAAIRARGN